MSGSRIRINCDYHIHTRYLGCGNQTMEVERIVRRGEELGLTSLAITDHLNRLEQLPQHLPIAEDIHGLDTLVDVYFGVELNFLECDGDFPYSKEIRDQVGFQFAIGGIHGTYLSTYDLEEIVAIQHRHHLKTCEDPLIDVLVHPWWFGKGEFDLKGFPWFDDMSVVPESLTRELAQAAKETNTAIEINACAILCSPYYGGKFQEQYLNYLQILKEEGVKFALGSDAHDISRLEHIISAQEVVKKLQIAEDQIWHPACPPFNHPHRL